MVKVVKENTQKKKIIWAQIPDQPYRLSTIGSSGSGKEKLYQKLIT